MAEIDASEFWSALSPDDQKALRGILMSAGAMARDDRIVTTGSFHGNLVQVVEANATQMAIVKRGAELWGARHPIAMAACLEIAHSIASHRRATTCGANDT